MKQYRMIEETRQNDAYQGKTVRATIFRTPDREEMKQFRDQYYDGIHAGRKPRKPWLSTSVYYGSSKVLYL